jgi:hypothetical protein
MISTRATILSICLRAATSPCSISILKYSNISLPSPPITCKQRQSNDNSRRHLIKQTVFNILVRYRKASYILTHPLNFTFFTSHHSVFECLNAFFTAIKRGKTTSANQQFYTSFDCLTTPLPVSLQPNTIQRQPRCGPK